MKKTDQIIADKVLSRQISLMRFTAGEKKKVLDLFLQMQMELKAKLQNGFTSFEKERITKLLKECNEIIEVFYGKMSPAVKTDFGIINTIDITKPQEKAFISRFAAEFETKISDISGFSYGSHEKISSLNSALRQKGFKGVSMDDFKGVYSLDKVIDNPALFKKYPALKEVNVVFADFHTATQRGVHIGNTIYLNSKIYAKDATTIEGTLVHEIEHTIQDIEGTIPKFSQFEQGRGMNKAEYAINQREVAARAKQAEYIAYKTETQATDLVGLAKAEAAASTKAMASIGLNASVPTASVLKAMVSDTLLQGAPLKAWWAKQAEDTAFKFSAQVRQGVAQGETLQQIITRVVGSEKKCITGVLDVSRRNASTLVHDSIMQIANDAKLAVYQENADIVKGVQWLATFDMHTCETCAAYHGAQWDLDGNPINGTTLPFITPPLHPNDRCVLTPVTKTYRELGIDIPEVTGLTRASDLGQIPTGTSFSDFLDRHSKAEQDKFFGKGKADLWREGKITLKDLVAQNGRPISLAQLSS